ncbi:hypothetical protein [Actinoallomurus vinaceus]
MRTRQPIESDPTPADPTQLDSMPVDWSLPGRAPVDPAEVDSTPFDSTPLDSTAVDPIESARLAAGRPDPTPAESIPTQPDSTPGEPIRPDPTPVDSTDNGRDWVVDLGLTAAGSGAVAASYSALKGLAHLTGWGSLDWLLWVCIDIYGLTATRVWLSRRTKSRKVRRFAAWNAIGAIGLSLAGNAAYHAIHARAWDLGGRFWMLVVAVSSVPPIIIGFIGHLAVLRTRDRDFAELESTQARSDSTAAEVESTPTRSDPAPAPAEVGSIPGRPETKGESTRPNSLPPVDSAGPDSAPIDSTCTSTGADRASEQAPADDKSADGEPDEDDLRPELIAKARELHEHRMATEGKKATAEYIRTRLRIAPPRARRLRDLVTNVHAVTSEDRSA